MNTLKLTRQTSTLVLAVRQGPTITLQGTARMQVKLAAQGVQGPPGPAGQAGGTEADPGDFTLLFENQLI